MTEVNIPCQYAREKKKRGKISKKILVTKPSNLARNDFDRSQSRQASSASSNLPSYNDLPHGAMSEPETSRPRLPPMEPDMNAPRRPSGYAMESGSNTRYYDAAQERRSRDSQTESHHLIDTSTLSRNHHVQRATSQSYPSHHLYGQADSQTPRTSNEDSFAASDHHGRMRYNAHLDGFTDVASVGTNNNTGPFGFLTLPSPASVASIGVPNQRIVTMCRYPVVQPVIAHIGSFLSQSLACELLDHYFETPAPSNPLPSSPYIFAFVYRKNSFLYAHSARSRSPALLASMLYVAAQTSDAPYLSSTPTRRSQICQKLFQLSVSLLKPLIHGTSRAAPNASMTVEPGLALGGLISSEQPGAEKSTHVSVDDVATYMHLATVVSASEFKRASLRWWGGAWYLAKELQLGQEFVSDPNAFELYPETTEEGQTDVKPPSMDEEEREERRRIWWILYLVERHLALCYNSPITLLDRECQGLFQPFDEDAWQSGSFLHTEHSSRSGRRPGPPLEFTGISVFGCVLPLMNILGQIVQLQDMRNQPRFTSVFNEPAAWDLHVRDIVAQLHVYEQSMHAFCSQLPPLPITYANNFPDFPRDSENAILGRTAVAYGTHIMHVLHILTAGKWDAIALFDDADGWISSPSFVAATGHAVAAADALSQVLELDPDLSFMPFLYGIYLLQGSFLLLLLADKLQQDAGAPVVRACETIVRAHEVCVVTLSTGYQVSIFSNHSPLVRATQGSMNN